MADGSGAKVGADRVWLSQDQCRIEDLAALADRETRLADYPLAQEVSARVLVYDGDAVRAAAASPGTRRALLAEWADALMTGPGVVVLRRMFLDGDMLDRASDAFRSIIDAQRASHTAVLLPSGKVLIAGGTNSASGSLRTSKSTLRVAEAGHGAGAPNS